MKLLVWLGTTTLFLVAPPALAEELPRPWVPTKDTVNVNYFGTVTEITKNSITIQWPGEKPKKFPVSAALAAGEIPKVPRPSPRLLQPYFVRDSMRYRLTDVAVGDVVEIRYAHLGDTDTCDHICIKKRPNGLVPPLPEGAVTIPKNLPPGFIEKNPSLFIPYHEQMNAYWDLEDRGIPYPAKFGPHRRWPVAPMPREVKPKPNTTP